MLDELSSLFPIVFDKMNNLEDLITQSKNNSELLAFEEAYESSVRLL